MTEALDAPGVLRAGLDEFGLDLAIASSFGAEDVVLIDIASRLGTPFRVFTLYLALQLV